MFQLPECTNGWASKSGGIRKDLKKRGRRRVKD